MGDIVKIGDEVELIVRGKLSDFRTGGYGGHGIKAESGIIHTVFLGFREDDILDGQTKHGVTVKKIQPPEVLEAGQAYIDDDGDIYIRSYDERWITAGGSKRSDSYAERPLRKLIPEV